MSREKCARTFQLLFTGLQCLHKLCLDELEPRCCSAALARRSGLARTLYAFVLYDAFSQAETAFHKPPQALDFITR